LDLWYLCRLGGFQAQRVSISEPIATIVAAVIAAAAGIIGTYFAYVLPEKRKRPALLADFIDTIAKDVTEMTTMFEREEIPHVAGHSLDSKIEFFETSTNQVPLTAKALETLTKLRELSKEAENVDTYMYLGSNGEPLRADWITKAKRIVGDLRGEAAKLRLG